MRRAHKVWAGIAAGVFGLVAISDLSAPATPTPVTTAVAAPAAAPAAPVAAPVVPAATAPAAPARRAAPVTRPRTVAVSEVIDGDTFVAAGQKVRVLGIDSCELGTDGGTQAKATAEGMLEGQEVTLRTQPGVDRDPYGRQLRYVELADGADFARSMVVHDDTGVHQGRNDAPRAYVTKLRDADPNGRTCAAPAPAAGGVGEDTGSIDWPSPGDQGMPDGALTGGYCKKKWWC